MHHPVLLSLWVLEWPCPGLVWSGLQMTNWDYYEAVCRFQRVLDVSGVNRALKAKGIQEVRNMGLIAAGTHVGDGS